MQNISFSVNYLLANGILQFHFQITQNELGFHIELSTSNSTSQNTDFIYTRKCKVVRARFLLYPPVIYSIQESHILTRLPNS